MTDLPPGRFCPSCNNEHSAVSFPDGKDPLTPKPGDMTVCVYCAEVLVYLEDCHTRPANLDDMLKAGDKAVRQIGAMQEAIRQTAVFGQRR
jgi:hypothetical protein